jgi:Uma2 family endonuclease
MSTPTSTYPEQDQDYPDNDAQPMSDNTLQFQWIVTLQGNLDVLFINVPDVFVGSDLLWYPVLGQPTIRMAPDTLVAFGRPKGYRGSYKQWCEEGIAPQVVFEVLSPGNRPAEIEDKFEFYEKYGVEEYYQYDPYDGDLVGWRRVGEKLEPIYPIHGWVSPRLGIRFDLSGDELVIYRPDGQRFLTFMELAQEQQQAKQRAEQEQREREEAERRAERDRQGREEAERRAQQERREREEAERRANQARISNEEAERRANQARISNEEAERRAEQERRDKEQAQQRAQRLAEQLRALGIDPAE